MNKNCTVETMCEADAHDPSCPSRVGTMRVEGDAGTGDVEALAEREREALLRTVHMATCYSAMKHTWESDEYIICVRTARAIISTGQWGSAQRDAQHDAQVAAAAEAAAGERIAQAIEARRWLRLAGNANAAYLDAVEIARSITHPDDTAEQGGGER